MTAVLALGESALYYRTTDPIENLNIRVEIRLVESGEKNIKPDAKAGDPAPGEDTAKRSEAISNIHWQEKIFSPRELLKYKKMIDDKGFLRATPSRAEADYVAEVRGLLASKRDLLSEINQVGIYTYIDKDGFVPPEAFTSPVTSLDEDPPLPEVGRAIVGLPLRGASAEASLLAHVSREHGCKIMYIMAATDVNPEAFQTEKAAYMHEQVLATIKAYGNTGLVEMKPGFSQIIVNDKTGEETLARLRFTTPRGSVFEYTLVNEGSANIAAVESLRRVELAQEAERLHEQQSRVATAFTALPSEPGVSRVHAMLEILTAEDFEGDQLYIQYQVYLPGPAGLWRYPVDVDPDDLAKGCTQTSRVAWRKRDVTSVWKDPQPVAHFCFPIELQLERRLGLAEPATLEEGEDASGPRFLFTVLSRDSWERHVVVGYGSYALPSQPGSYTERIMTWRPEGSVRRQVADWFVGGARRLSDAKYVAIPDDAVGTGFLSKFAFRTISGGCISVRVNSLHMTNATVEEKAGLARSPVRGVGRRVSEILRQHG